MKYIIFNYGGLDRLVIFDNLFNHSDVAAMIGMNVVSAGKIGLDLMGVSNGSVTLNKKYSAEQTLGDLETVKEILGRE